jgi:hypothetical protein
MSIRTSTISDNAGPGCVTQTWLYSVMESSLVTGNEGNGVDAGGSWSDIAMTGNTIAYNAGDGARLPEPGNPYPSELVANLIADNEGSGLWANDPSLVMISCTDVFGNVGGDWEQVPGMLGVEGNFSADPFFCDPDAGDFALRADSPCLAGNHPDGASCDRIGAAGLGCYAAFPVLSRIEDVGNDQGRWVRLAWYRSVYDAPGDSVDVTGYGIFRREDEYRVQAMHSPGETIGVGAADPRRLSGWDYLETVPAFGEDEYQYVAPTLCDSTAGGGICWSVFMVRAITLDPFTYFDSKIDSGYSVDNLPPQSPESFQVAHSGDGNALSWNSSAAPDLDHYGIFRWDRAEGDTSLVHTTISNSWLDECSGDDPWDFDYALVAYDRAGNSSGWTPPDVVLSAGGRSVPASSALFPNVPNPFNPSTTIRYSLATASAVELRVFDPAGRLVRTLVAEKLVSPGMHEAVWDGKDDAGREMAAGVFLYRLKAGSFLETGRMALVK